jgi:hypothetical protein
MKCTSEIRMSSLRIHNALVKARVLRYPEVYECSFDRPLSELASVENMLAHFVDTDIQVLRNNFAR